MLANLFSFAASWNISSRRRRACTIVLDILGCMCVRRDCDILYATAMIASAGVTDGFVIYLCLNCYCLKGTSRSPPGKHTGALVWFCLFEFWPVRRSASLPAR